MMGCGESIVCSRFDETELRSYDGCVRERGALMCNVVVLSVTLDVQRSVMQGFLTVVVDDRRYVCRCFLTSFSQANADRRSFT